MSQTSRYITRAEAVTLLQRIYAERIWPEQMAPDVLDAELTRYTFEGNHKHILGDCSNFIIDYHGGEVKEEIVVEEYNEEGTTTKGEENEVQKVSGTN